MGFFSSKKEEKQPDWAAEVQETKDRFFVFLEKLEVKMKELCEAAIPELTEMYQTDPDIFHREYTRMKSGIMGQMEHIREKAYEVHEEKILGMYSEIYEMGIRATHPHYDIIGNFRSTCGDRHNQFEEQYNEWCDKIEATSYEDLEIKYQNVLKEYEAIKDKFTCKQCGSPITINEIFFIDVFLPCPSCQTQNTFSPSTQAKMLQHFAQDLARQRTANLYNEMEDAIQRERDLYMEIHENREHMSDNAKQKKERAELRTKLQAEHQAVSDSLPKLHEKYVRTKYEEWIKITPFQKEHLLQRMENDLAETSYHNN